jgi:hypothetical protein
VRVVEREERASEADGMGWGCELVVMYILDDGMGVERKWMG